MHRFKHSRFLLHLRKICNIIHIPKMIIYKLVACVKLVLARNEASLKSTKPHSWIVLSNYIKLLLFH